MSPRKLQVAIIGGGIAGLAAARVLREQHDVTIYERSKTTDEVGAAINIGPNGVAILDALGFDRSRACSIPVEGTKCWNSQGTQVMERLVDYKEAWGADWLFQHRIDLRNELLRLATKESESLGISGDPARICWGCELTEIDPDEGRFTLSSGEEIRADLIIAADGIKSSVRARVVGDISSTLARPSGYSAFRFTLPAAKAQEAVCGPMSSFVDRTKPVCLSMVLALDGTRRSVVMYPCRDFKLLNFVCIVSDESLKTETTESWSAAGDREEMLSLFNDFPPWVLAALGAADGLKLWQLRDQDPLPTYVRGRTVLVGDAAHAMTPHQGQGGTQAIEDAEGFRLFLGGDISPDDVEKTLLDFDKVRRPRASQIQENTRKSAERRSAEDVYQFEKYNWTYPGVRMGLERLNAGEPLIA